MFPILEKMKKNQAINHQPPQALTGLQPAYSNSLTPFS